MAANANTTQGNRPISVKFPFPIRTNSITDDYIVSGDVAGVGVSGQVYRIQSRRSGETYALKILTDSDLSRREVILHTKACEDCEYIVKILHVYKNMFLKRKSILIVMEYMEGGELFNRITSRSTHGYTERDAARLIAMIVQAVTHLHSMDIAHRDLKLENLLFATKEDDSILKLTDFGFAKEGNNEDLPYKTPCFTPYYVAPEVISKTRYDKACDIWSMGVILYILLCGFPPFYSKHDNTCLSDDMARKIKAGDYQFDQNEWGSISDEAKSTIQQMLKVNPAERITIDKIRDCSWLTGLTSDRPINLNLLQDVDTRNQIESEFTNANNLQRRLDQDGSDGVMTVRGPEASRIAKKRAAHKRRLEVGQERTTTE